MIQDGISKPLREELLELINQPESMVEENHLLDHSGSGHVIKFGKKKGQLASSLWLGYFEFMLNEVWYQVTDDVDMAYFLDVAEDIITGADHVLTHRP